MTTTRRDFLVTGAAGLSLAAAAVPSLAAAAAPRTRRLRIAHLTDIHLQPELGAARGFAACLAHVQTQPTAVDRDVADNGTPNLIITGGDTIMDAFEADMARTKLQWELWRKLKADHCGLEVHSVVGNHDVWGWSRVKAGTTGTEPLYGKRWVCDEFGRDLSYTSFDRGGWHIVLLDSVFPHEQSYIGRLDDAQWDWLERDLAAVDPATPVIIFSHIPILSATPLAVAGPAKPETALINIPGGRIHVDGDRFLKLFTSRRNIKACASGHMHLVEQLDYQGVRYLCNGAVSAGWWKGLNRDTDFGYAVIDLFDDGTIERHYVPYGWTATT
jgi:predicted MPP superfamily phosphohydrolase